MIREAQVVSDRCQSLLAAALAKTMYVENQLFFSSEMPLSTAALLLERLWCGCLLSRLPGISGTHTASGEDVDLRACPLDR